LDGDLDDLLLHADRLWGLRAQADLVDLVDLVDLADLHLLTFLTLQIANVKEQQLLYHQSITISLETG